MGKRRKPKNKNAAPPAAQKQETAGAPSAPNAPPALQQVDPMVLSKRLAPVYKAVDAGNSGRAMKLLDQLMQKFGRHPLFLVLKSHALINQEKPEECRMLLDEARLYNPIDVPTLNTMATVYRKLNLGEEVSSMYDSAVKTDGRNEELHVQLFESLGSDRNFMRQQQVAIMMFKQFKKLEYLFRAIVCMELQIIQGQDDLRILQLAQTMLERNTDDIGSLPYEHLMLYVSILQRRQLYPEIVQVLTQAVVPNQTEGYDRALIVSDALFNMRDLKTRLDVIKESLDTYPDQWNLFKMFIEAHFKLPALPERGASESASDESKSSAPPSDGADVEFDPPSLDSLKEFISNRQSKEKISRRSSYLADLHVHHCILRTGPDGEIVTAEHPAIEDLRSSILEYFRKFGGKPCFFSDTSLYLEHFAHLPSSVLFKRKLIKSLTDIMNKLAPADKDESKSSERRTRMKTSIVQCRRYLDVDSKFTVEDAVSHANYLFDSYVQGRAFGSSADPSEDSPADTLALLCAHTLMDVYELTKSRRYLVDAICALEYTLEFRPNNAQIKLLLMRLYAHPEFGAVHKSNELFASLDARNILAESISHIIFEDLVRYGAFTEALTVADNTIKFQSGHERVAPRHTTHAYRLENFRKVKEFEEFSERLRTSSQLCKSLVWRNLIDFVQLAERSPSKVNVWLTEREKKFPSQFPLFGRKGDPRKLDRRRKEAEAASRPFSPLASTLSFNEDYSLVLSWDCPSEAATKFPSARAEFLNVPAPPILASQSPSTFLKSAEDFDSHKSRYIQMSALVPEILKAAIDNNHFKLRHHVTAFEGELRDLGVVDMSAADTSETTRTFQDSHWRLAHLIVEASACASEAGGASLEFLAAMFSLPTDIREQQLVDHISRWTSLDRQYKVITDLLGVVARSVLSGLATNPLSLSKSPKKQEEKEGSAKPFYVRGESLAEVCILLSHVANWLTLLIQVWATLTLSPKAFNKKVKTPAEADESLVKLKDAALEPYTTARASLRSLAHTLTTVLNQLQAGVVRARGASPTSLLSDDTQFVASIEFMKSKPELSRRVATAFDDSRRKTFSSIGDMISRHLRALKSLKL